MNLTWDEHLTALEKLLANPKQGATIRFASFGVSPMAQITPAQNRILRRLSELNSFGFINYCPSRCQCLNCTTASSKTYTNIEAVIAHYRLTNFKIKRDSHLKLVDNGTNAVIGGINFTGSGWLDCSHTIRSSARLRAKFDEFWESGPAAVLPVSTDSNQVVFTSGKYAGYSPREVPIDYCAWVYINCPQWPVRVLEECRQLLSAHRITCTAKH